MTIKLFFKTIDEIKGNNKLKGISISEMKKRFEILIIDDEEFSYLDLLKKHEYNIVQKKDLSDLRDAEAYDIVLCDIRGVGKFLASEFGGAYLIKQLKEKYPDKTIIAYTATDYDARFQEYLNYADEIVAKGSYTLENWTALLDKLLEEKADPVKLWEKARVSLMRAGVSMIDIAEYESDYVKAIQKGKFESFKKIYSKKSDRGAEIMLALFKVLPKLITAIV